MFVRPKLIVEVAFSGLQESPPYPGGLASRFAGAKRYRPDKGPLETDIADKVRQIIAAGRV